MIELLHEIFNMIFILICYIKEKIWYKMVKYLLDVLILRLLICDRNINLVMLEEICFMLVKLKK